MIGQIYRPNSGDRDSSPTAAPYPWFNLAGFCTSGTTGCAGRVREFRWHVASEHTDRAGHAECGCSIFRDITLHENWKLQIRGDAVNASTSSTRQTVLRSAARLPLTNHQRPPRGWRACDSDRRPRAVVICQRPNTRQVCMTGGFFLPNIIGANRNWNY